ncbi:MAG: beta-galactosidase, partial [Terracidiphilus sp.]
MGEFHFSRYPEAYWEEEILKMKASGVRIISTYVFWIHIEEVEGQFDWSGQRNLREFALLCAKHGMLLYPRIGPWAHGEARNGGLPDWVVKNSSIRSNDPVYLSEVRRFYAQIGGQLHGLLWKDGGPVIGIQIENEYSLRGPGKGREHLATLKRMAIESGLDVPLYTVTGWDNAVVPADLFLPVYGGYPDAPWDGSTSVLPPSEVYSFRFGSRVTGDMGAHADGNVPNAERDAKLRSEVPFLTAEVGGGMQDTYHRRPALAADDIEAMIPVMIGSGANLLGCYMYQGGENPDGKLTTLQE